MAELFQCSVWPNCVSVSDVPSVFHVLFFCHVNVHIEVSS